MDRNILSQIVIYPLTFDELRLPPELQGEFRSLEDEVAREYSFDDMDIMITDPVALRISESGGHYVIDRQHDVHYIPAGWKCLSWTPRDDADYHMSFA